MKKFVLAFILCFHFSIAVFASNYYVATTGNNSNPGTLAAPFKTIQYASNKTNPGDFVYVRGGTYLENLTITRSGNATAGLITYTNYDGEEVIVDGDTTKVSYSWGIFWSGLIQMRQASYITISNFTVNNAGFIGILARTDNASRISYIKILNCNINHAESSGIHIVGADSVIVKGNEINDCCRSQAQENISIVTVSDFTISHNKVHNSVGGGEGQGGGEGIDCKVGCTNGKVSNNLVFDMGDPVWGARTGIYIDGYDKTSSDIEVFNNTVYNTGAGINLGAEKGGSLSDIKIYNNIIYDNHWSGISLSGWRNTGFPVPPMANILIYNNTIFNNGIQAYLPWGDPNGGIVINNPAISNIVVKNNIIRNNLYNSSNGKGGQLVMANSHGTPLLSAMKVSNNVINGLTNSGFEYSGGSPVKTPVLFIDEAGRDFHLSTGSSAINTGENLTSLEVFTTDFDGVSRPATGGWAIGAYEHVNTAVSDIYIENDLLVYPNPAKNIITVKFSGQNENEMVEIYNITGSLVKEQKISAIDRQINIEDLPNGFYAICINNLIVKFIKQ